jgi:hypothetical protein
MKDDRILSNGDDATVANLDLRRVQRLIDITGPIFAIQKKPIRDGLRPQDVATNEFIDDTIGFDAK